MTSRREAVSPHSLSDRRRTSEPLRIAVIGPSRYPVREPFPGGLEALVWHLVTGLRRRGHHVTLFAAEGSDHAEGAASLPLADWEPSRSARGDVSMPPGPFMVDHHSHLRLMLALGGPLADRFDLVHNHSLHYLPVAMAPSLTRPMLTTLHTPPTPWLESAIDAPQGRTASHFTAVSRFVADQWSLPDGPADVVLNGVEPAHWPVGPGGSDLVWSGRIVPEKAPHLAIEVARLAGRRLVLAGPVHDDAYFDRCVRPLLGPDVRYAGHLDSVRLARLVGEAAAVLVTPVWDEPYGLVVAEALTCGTPVVAFRRGGIPEILVSPLLGELVAPDDTVAMAAAVDRVAMLDRRQVRELALRHLSRASMVTGYERIYRRLLTAASAEASLPA